VCRGVDPPEGDVHGAGETLPVNNGDFCIGPVLLKKWFNEAAAGTWEQAQEDYGRVKLLVTCVKSRTKPLDACEEAEYQADLAKYRPKANAAVMEVRVQGARAHAPAFLAFASISSRGVPLLCRSRCEA
jgi:hypothetical protein